MHPRNRTEYVFVVFGFHVFQLDARSAEIIAYRDPNDLQ